MKWLLLSLLICLSLFYSSCSSCTTGQSSLEELELRLHESDGRIDSVVFRNTNRKITPRSSYALVNINPGDTVCAYDIYIDGEHRFVELHYTKEVVYDCDTYFLQYSIDTIMHNFALIDYFSNNSIIILTR